MGLSKAQKEAVSAARQELLSRMQTIVSDRQPIVQVSGHASAKITVSAVHQANKDCLCMLAAGTDKVLSSCWVFILLTGTSGLPLYLSLR